MDDLNFFLSQSNRYRLPPKLFNPSSNLFLFQSRLLLCYKIFSKSLEFLLLSRVRLNNFIPLLVWRLFCSCSSRLCLRESDRRACKWLCLSSPRGWLFHRWAGKVSPKWLAVLFVASLLAVPTSAWGWVAAAPKPFAPLWCPFSRYFFSEVSRPLSRLFIRQHSYLKTTVSFFAFQKYIIVYVDGY